jgi:hypothetical protein
VEGVAGIELKTYLIVNFLKTIGENGDNFSSSRDWGGGPNGISPKPLTKK